MGELRREGSEEALLLHLTPREHWERHEADTPYSSETFADERFIHCTHGEAAVLEVGNRYYRTDPRPFVLLEVVRVRVSAPVKYEDPSGLYPHVYGAIERAAIMRARHVVRDAGGTFLAIGEAEL